MKIIVWLLSYLKKYRITVLIFISTSLLAIISQLLIPYLIRLMIDSAVNNKSYMHSTEYIYFFIFSLLVFLTANWINRRLIYIFQEKPTNDITIDTLRKLNELGFGFYESHSVGEILSNFTSGISAAREIYSRFFPTLVRNSVTLFVALFFLSNIHVLLSLTILICYLPYFFVKHYFENKVKKIMGEQANSKKSLDKNIYNALSSYKELRAFSEGIWAKIRVENSFSTFKKIRLNTIKMRYRRGSIYRFITAFGVTVDFFFALLLLKKGNITLGGFSTCFFYTTTVMWVLNGIFYTITEQELYLSQIENIYKLNYLKPKRTITHKLRLNMLGDIEFNNVSFAYHSGNSILNNISFKIKAGEHIAFVGKTGSGKSTILKLISNFYTPKAGEIKFDGVSAVRLDPLCIRRAISFFFQEIFVWGVTIKENISFGSTSSDAKIVQAAKEADAHNFIMSLPQGYDTILSEKGTSLSGGQKQRIALARAINKDSSILILDEATSSLDSINESLIQKVIDSKMRNKTIITVAHRISSIRNYDRIFLIADGHIVEEGNYEELMSKREEFYKFVRGNQNE